MTARAIAGFTIAVVIAGIARQRQLLSASGAIAAIVIGTLAMIAGVRWGTLLVVYFVAATALSAWRGSEKARLTANIVEKTGPRDAWQVLANGSAFVVASLVAAVSHSPTALAAALGAIATSMADTWATEVGSAIGGEPRLITSGQKVARGRSGGVTGLGTLAMLAGATLLGTSALILGFSDSAVRGAIAGGMVGALADSLLGAVVQERRQCPACGMLTERRLHHCRVAPGATQVVGGLKGFDNDWVNLTSTAIGALVAAVSSRGGI